MGQRVGSAKILLEGNSTHHGRQLHISPGLNVIRLTDSSFKILCYKFYSLKGDCITHGMKIFDRQGFNAMGKGIHSGSCGEGRGHSHGEFRVKQCNGRNQQGAADKKFPAKLYRRDDRAAPHFTAGTGSCGNGHHWGKRPFYILISSCRNIIIINPAAMACYNLYHLSCIKGTAATKSNESVAHLIFIDIHCLLDITVKGIRINL